MTKKNKMDSICSKYSFRTFVLVFLSFAIVFRKIQINKKKKSDNKMGKKKNTVAFINLYQLK